MATFERKCRQCGKWAIVPGLGTTCPLCRTPFGKLDLGFDRLVRVDPDEAVDPKTAGRKKLPAVKAEESKAPLPKPGEFGYRPTGSKRGA